MMLVSIEPFLYSCAEMRVCAEIETRYSITSKSVKENIAR